LFWTLKLSWDIYIYHWLLQFTGYLNFLWLQYSSLKCLWFNRYATFISQFTSNSHLLASKFVLFIFRNSMPAKRKLSDGRGEEDSKSSVKKPKRTEMDDAVRFYSLFLVHMQYWLYILHFCLLSFIKRISVVLYIHAYWLKDCITMSLVIFRNWCKHYTIQ